MPAVETADTAATKPPPPGISGEQNPRERTLLYGE